ncbi:MAG: polysaccharide deacetylase [Bacilli bacterium]|nr:polysaccharide deacetylase [Bacilli bacterium]
MLPLIGCSSPITGSAVRASDTPTPPQNPAVVTAYDFAPSDQTDARYYRSIAKWPTAPEVPILMYHSISKNPGNTLCVDPEVFRQEMQHLNDAGYTSITFEQLSVWAKNGKLPTKPVLITLDDGYRDNYTNAFQVLKSTRTQATIFVITSYIDSGGSLTWDEMDEMSQSGFVEFGSHTVSHLDLSQLPGDVSKYEINKSKQTLDAHFGYPTIAFCYPSGRFNDAVVQQVKSAGYQFAVTTQPGDAQANQGLLSLERVRIAGDMSADTFGLLFP